MTSSAYGLVEIKEVIWGKKNNCHVASNFCYTYKINVAM